VPGKWRHGIPDEEIVGIIIHKLGEAVCGFSIAGALAVWFFHAG
jgi:hypothetical protein